MTTLRTASLRSAVARAAALACIVAAPAVAGAQAFNTDAPMVGSRTGSFLDVGGNYTSSFNVAWSITDAGTSLLRYTYTFTGFGSPGISHLIVGLSENCRQSLTCVLSPTVRGTDAGDFEIGTFAAGPSNPGLATSFYGVKIDTPQGVNGQSGVTFSFLSDRMPVYGDFYAKGGSSYAQNDGLLAGNRLSGDVNLFVARPDGVVVPAVVPEPGTVALLGAGLAGLAAAARRRRQA
jgi:hypothetical protein